MRIMYDSTVPGNIPETGANMIGCYNDGSFENVVEMIKRFPNMQLITIDVNGSDPACRVLDYEPGDVQSPATAIAWVKASQEKGNLYPTVYCDRTDYATLVHAFEMAGIVPGQHVYFWVATLDGTWKQLVGLAGVVAVQYQDTGTYDVSVVLDDGWVPAAVPPPPARHATIQIDGFPVALPTTASVPAVISWYGDAGITRRLADIPMEVWKEAITWL